MYEGPTFFEVQSSWDSLIPTGTMSFQTSNVYNDNHVHTVRSLQDSLPLSTCQVVSFDRKRNYDEDVDDDVNDDDFSLMMMMMMIRYDVDVGFADTHES